MAIPKRLPLSHHSAFPYPTYLLGEVTAVLDFNAPARADGIKPQQMCKDTGLPLWSVPIVDSDPVAGKRDKTVTVKIAAAHQPVPPVNETPFPFTPVEFVGLTALPYVEETGNGRSRIAWSFRAEGMVAPGQDAKSQPVRKSEAA